MNRKNIIPILIVLMATSLIGIVAAQIYWIKETFWLTQRQIDTEIIGIMEHAIQKTEAEVNNRLIAADLGIDFSNSSGMAAKKDSLYRLKYMIDSMELAVAEAEINKKLGVKPALPNLPKSPTVGTNNLAFSATVSNRQPTQPNPNPANVCCKPNPEGGPENPNKPAISIASSPYPDRNYYRIYAADQSALSQATGQYFGVNNPWSAPVFSNGYSQTSLYGTTTPSSSSSFNVYTEGQPGSGLGTAKGNGLTAQIGQGATLTDGQIVVLANGRKMRVNIDPYIKTHVGVKQPSGRYIYADQQTMVEDFQLGRIGINDQASLNQLPGMWLGQVDSIYTALAPEFRVRQGRRQVLRHFNQQMEEFTSKSRQELSALRSINRRLAKVRAGNNTDILRYVDSLTKRQVEIAFSVARTQDSFAQLNNRILAPELSMQNDVLAVANQSCNMAPSAPNTDFGADRRGRQISSSNQGKSFTFRVNGDKDQQTAQLTENNEQAEAPIYTRNQQKDHRHQRTLIRPQVEIYRPAPTIVQQNPAQPAAITLAGLGRLGASVNRLIQSAALNSPDANPIDTGLLAAHLRKEFRLRNLDLDFEYAIINSNLDQVRPTFASAGFRTELTANSYKASLFPNEVNSGLFLSLYLQDRDSYALYNLKWSMLASVLFLVMIIGVFTAGIMTIIRQKRLSVIKSDFISNMTHELKTPLATISLAADTINSNAVLIEPDKIKYFTGIIKEENQRMNGHIERVLQMALLDKGEFRLKKTELNLVELVLDQGEYMSLSVANKGGFLDVDIPEDDLPIFADKLQIQSLLSNLIDNALKYCERVPHILVTVKQEGNYALLSVRDNGIGISEKAQKRIFDRFYRVAQGDLHDVKGFGLGLSFVKAIVEAHEGSVEVQSSCETGSCFMIRLPLITENS